MALKKFVAKNGLDNNNQTISNVADPVNGTDAVNKDFVSTAQINANLAFTHANSAYDFANTRYSSSGGIISGNVDINGTLSISSNTLVSNLNSELLDSYHASTSNTANTVVVRDANTFISLNGIYMNSSEGMKRIAWNNTYSTYDMQLLDGVTLQVGQESHVYGRATENIQNGQAVMFAGAQGDGLLLRVANTQISGFEPRWIVGIATQNILENEWGYVTWFGKVSDLNTFNYSLGDILYIDNSVVGGLSNTKPIAPNYAITMAAVVRVASSAEANNGILMVRPDFGSKLNELHDVRILNVSANDVLIYSSANTRWENKPQSDIVSGDSDRLEGQHGSFYTGYTDTANTNNLIYTNNAINSNVTLLQGINTTQNTRLTVVEGIDVTQNTNISNLTTWLNSNNSLQEGINNTQNNNITVIQGVDATQNTRLTNIENVNLTQNTNISDANTWLQANDYSTLTTAKSYTDTANTNNLIYTNNAISSNVTLIQGVDATQNTRLTVIEGTDLTQNTNISSVTTSAQAAFTHANSAFVSSNTKFSSSGGTITGDVVITGNVAVQGTTTTLDVDTITIEDKNITLANVASPTDITADGAGLTILGATNKTWNWVDATDSWTSSENINLVSGKTYKINGVDVLTSTTLGSEVTSSSLTSVGTLVNLTVTNPISGSVTGSSNNSNYLDGLDSTYFTNASNISSGTLPNARLSSIPNSALANSSLTINGTDISLGGSGTVTVTATAETLTGTTLNSTVVSSSLTSVGTITSGTWSGSFGPVSGANLTGLTAGNLSGTIPSAVLGNSTHYVGTTAIALNRGSASQTLTGVSIDGNAATLTTARTLTIGSTGKTFNGSADVSWSLAEIGAYAASNPSGYTTNTGTVTSVGGTGTVSGLSLSGTVTTSGNLTLGGTLSASIDNISDEYRLFNNMGANHGTRASFDAQGAASTVDFGCNFVQGSTNGPGVNSAGQYYSLFLGLGNEYAYNTYGAQIAIPRNVTNPYIAIRYEEGGVFAAWQKISAGYADSAGSVAWSGITSKPTTVDGYGITNAFYYPGWPGSPGTDANTMTGNRSSFTYSNNAPLTGCIAYWDAGGYGIQLNGDYNGDSFSMRSRNGDAGTWRPWKRLLTDYNYTSYAMPSGSSATNSVDVRAPIFYDSNDTGYYIDPNSTTRVNLLKTTNWLYLDNNYGHSIVGVYTSTIFQGVFAMGDSYKLTAGGGINNLYGMCWSHPNAGGIAANLDSHGMIVAINGGFGSCMSYSIKASGNVTAYSDERLKKNWGPMPENFVSRLAKVKVGTYDRMDGERLRQVGVSAQSLRPLLPEAVIEANDDIKTLSVSYGNAAMASAVELAKEIIQLKDQINLLTERLNKMGC